MTAGADRGWLRETMARASLRHGRALHALSLLPGPIALTYLCDDPHATDVQDAADAIGASVRTAITELQRLETYVQAVADRRHHAYGPLCGECGADLDVFDTSTGLQHCDLNPSSWGGKRTQPYLADHDPRPVWNPPPRPDWSTDDTDLAADQSEDDQVIGDPGGTRHQASPPGSLRKEHHPS